MRIAESYQDIHDSGVYITLNMEHLYRGVLKTTMSSKNIVYTVDGKGAQRVLARVKVNHSVYEGNRMVTDIFNENRHGRYLMFGSTPEILEQVKKKFNLVNSIGSSPYVPSGKEDMTKLLADLKIEWESFDKIFVALGVPKQEKFALLLADRFPAASIYCIGGSFEMLAGRFKRCPAILRYFWLEGLWRLFLEFNKKRLFRLLYSTYYFFVFMINPKLVRG